MSDIIACPTTLGPHRMINAHLLDKDASMSRVNLQTATAESLCLQSHILKQDQVHAVISQLMEQRLSGVQYDPVKSAQVS